MNEKLKDIRTEWKKIANKKVSYEEFYFFCFNYISNIKSECIPNKYKYYLENNISKCSELFYSQYRSNKYWSDRGWSEIESLNKVKEIQSKNSNIDSIMDRYNITKDEAILLRKNWIIKGQEKLRNNPNIEEINKSKSFLTKYNWYKRINPLTNKHYTEDEAKFEISKIQRKNSNKRKEKILNGNLQIINNTTLQYWLNKGLNEEEAKEALKNRQTTFSLEKCIEKYGLEKGTIKFLDRQKKWQNTLNTRYTHEYLLNKRLKFFKRYSKVSIIFFDKLISRLKPFYNFTYFYKENEWFIYDKEAKKIYFYDFYIKELNLFIEFHGIVYHPNKNLLSKEEFKKWHTPHGISSDIIYNKDMHKKFLVEKNNGIYLVVWEQSLYDKEIEKIIEIIKIKTQNKINE